MTVSITINPDDPASLERALNTEWLLTNGLGGYAMGTALGVNTRRYHGLLVAATTPPVGRVVALHSMIEQLVFADQTFELSTQQFGERLLLHPSGWRSMVSTGNDGTSVFSTLRHGPINVLRSCSMMHGRNAIVLHYRVGGITSPATMRLRPMTPLRDFHDLHESTSATSLDADHEGNVRMHRDQFILQWSVNWDYWHYDPQWWNNFAYLQDRQRSQDWLENVWSGGYFEFEVMPGIENEFRLIVELSVRHAEPLHISPCSSTKPDLKFDRRLAAADQFVVRRRVGKEWFNSVIAGYPWFGDWGRDTMIALPGLMICTGRLEDARSTLVTFARHIRNGLIPNLFDDYGGAAHYNTVDASLWFVHAVHEVWLATKQADPELMNACRTIIGAYHNGTDFNIHMDGDGLITAGDENSQLTWMDAKRDGVVFTPRYGKAVEINALWFNALRCLAEMTKDESERDDLVATSRKVAESFRKQFWRDENHGLHDVLLPCGAGSADRHSNAYKADGKLRPNQIFAASLPFSPLDEKQKRAVVKVVGNRLLTPFGLRTLDRDDPSYRGRYEGNLFERDRAYHNGTVWPWLIGPYCAALLRVENFSANAKNKVRAIIQPLIDEMNNTEGGRCLNQIAEVYDGDPPHRPGGCPAQAWSVAEVLRISTLVEQ